MEKIIGKRDLKEFLKVAIEADLPAMQRVPGQPKSFRHAFGTVLDEIEEDPLVRGIDLIADERMAYPRRVHADLM